MNNIDRIHNSKLIWPFKQKQMYILLFISMAQAEFVPFLLKEYPEDVSLPVVNSTELEELANQNIKVVAMGFSRRHPHYQNMLKAYYEFAHHFSSDAVFVIYDHDHAKNQAKKMGLNVPIVFYYDNSSLVTAYPYLDNEVGFAKILELIFHHEDSPVALNKNDLYKLIGDLNFAILAPSQTDFQIGLKLHQNLSSNYAEIDVVRVAPEVLNELGLNSEQPALYRKEDSCIVSFRVGSPDFVDDLKSFIHAALPVYKIYQASDFINENYEMFVFTSPTFTDEMKDFLFEISPRFPEYNFGYLRPEFLKLGEVAFNENFENRTDMHFCNFARRWRIEIDGIFHWEFVKQPFNKEKWTEATEKAVKVIQNGRKKIFISESVPVSIPGSLIKKIVGTTYKEFINDKDHDILMMYLVGNCKRCKEFKPTFINFVKEFNETGKTFLKFGWINVDRNSSEEPFPYIPGFPHFELFPAKNKSAHEMFRGTRSRDNLVRFLKNRCMEEFPLTAPPPDKVQTLFSLVNLMMNTPFRMPDDEVPKLMQYVSETCDSIGLDISSIPGFEQYANKLSPSKKKAQEEAQKKAAELKEETEKIKEKLEEEEKLKNNENKEL